MTIASLGGGVFAAIAIAFASLADLSKGRPEKERTCMFSVFESFLFMGLLAGPSIGGVLADHIGYKHSFCFTFGVNCAGLLILLFALPETHDSPGGGTRPEAHVPCPADPDVFFLFCCVAGDLFLPCFFICS